MKEFSGLSRRTFVISIMSLSLTGLIFISCARNQNELQLKTKNGIIEGIQDSITSVKIFLADDERYRLLDKVYANNCN